MAINKKFKTISIPKTIYEATEAYIKDKGFPSVSSFAAYILREYVKGGKEELNADARRVKKRLKEMGYL